MLSGLYQPNRYTSFTSADRKPQPKKVATMPAVEVWNPYTYEMCKTDMVFNRLKPCAVDYTSEKYSGDTDHNIELIYNPELTNVVNNKNENKFNDIMVFESKSRFNDSQHALHFISEDMQTEYGFVSFSDHTDKNGTIFSPTERGSILDRNYPELNLIGERVEIEYVQNLEPDKIKRFGEMVNKCVAEKIVSEGRVPNIVCYAHGDSHVSDYKSGLRFLPLDKGSKQYRYFESVYGTPNPNKVMEKLLSESDGKIDTSDWGDLGMYLPRDFVEKHLKRDITTDLTVKSPYSKMDYHGFICMDTDKPKTYILNPEKGKSRLVAEYNPDKNGYITDKETGLPLKTLVLKISHPNRTREFTYLFMSEDMKKKYGQVELRKEYAERIREKGLAKRGVESDLYKDYPKYGITGDRVIVEWLKNDDETKYSGIGKLADRLAVEYCLETGIKPNIVSAPARLSHVAHYKRGKRFVEPNEGDMEYYFLLKNYNCTNPNRILKKLVKESDKTGEIIDISGWGGYVIYMPKNLIDKYSDSYKKSKEVTP